MEVAAKGQCQQTTRQRATEHALVEPETKGKRLQDARLRDTAAANTVQALVEPEGKGQDCTILGSGTYALQALVEPESEGQ